MAGTATPVRVPKNERIRPMVTADAAKRKILARLPDTQVTCRARGHRWPDLDPGKPLPAGITSLYLREQGVFQQTETCERCGKQRSRVTLPPGIYPTLPNGPYPPGAHWAYTDPQDWEAVSIDEDISRGDITAEFNYRMRELLYKVPRGSK